MILIFLNLSLFFIFCFVIILISLIFSLGCLKTSILIIISLSLRKCICSLINNFIHCKCPLRKVTSFSFDFTHSPIMNIFDNFLSRLEIFYIIIKMYLNKNQALYKSNDNNKWKLQRKQPLKLLKMCFFTIFKLSI